MSRKKLINNTLITFTDMKSPEAEAFKVLRTNLQFLSVDRPLKKILFTSAGPDEGKSLVMSNLAVALAQTGKRVLIMDCDLRLPVQHKIFELSNTQGITNALANGYTVTDYISETNVPGVSLLTAGPIPPNPSELLGSERMNMLLQEVSALYDYVLLDAPPVLAVTDAVLLASKTDGVIIVTLSGRNQIKRVKDTKDYLLRGKATLLGVVLNGIERSSEEKLYYYYYKDEK